MRRKVFYFCCAIYFPVWKNEFLRENFLVRGFFLKILVFGTITLFAARQYNVERSAGGYAKWQNKFLCAENIIIDLFALSALTFVA